MDNSTTNNPSDNPTLQPNTQSLQNTVTTPTPIQTESQKPKNNGFKKYLLILCGVVLGIIILAVTIVLIVSATSKKFECTSSQGDITIMYDDNTITGYMANGISYDLDNQKSYAEQIGIEKYLSEFDNWFKANTDGSCVKK